MNRNIQLAVAAFAFSTSSTAYAGGIGLLYSGGLHQERAYYYSPTGAQGVDNQFRPNYGPGFETLVGDKDDKIQGVLRMNLMNDLPPEEPDTNGVANTTAPASHEQDVRKVGSLGLGLQWGLLGDPSGAQLVAMSVVGSGFITTDNTEFMFLEAGLGGTYSITDTIQAHASVAGTARVRKHWSYGPSVYAGFRYMFD
jgi:hypothetical protein